jgi:hypothetical protein
MNDCNKNDCFINNKLLKLEAENEKLKTENEELKKCIKKSQHFINNGIEFHYIRLPESKADPAHKTPGFINNIVLKYKI